MVKLYAFLWHVSVKDLEASEGSAGSYCQAAEANRPTKAGAKKVLKAWFKTRLELCQDKSCEHTPIISAELTPKMIMADMTNEMVAL